MSNVYEAGKRIRIHRVFTPDVALDVSASTVIVNLTDYSDGGAITDLTGTGEVLATPTANNVDVVVEYSIPDDAATGLRVITIDVDGDLVDVHETPFYVLARQDQPVVI